MDRRLQQPRPGAEVFLSVASGSRRLFALNAHAARRVRDPPIAAGSRRRIARSSIRRHAPHRGDRPARAAARGRRRSRIADADAAALRDSQDVGSRRAADRRRRRLRARAGARPRRDRRRARAGARDARRDATDRRQPALGARSRARGGRAACRARRAPTPRGGKPTPSPARTSRSTTRSACTASRCCARSRAQRSGPVGVMTHCNAGALATCGWGTATAPLFLAHAEGLPLHVWVSETRPRLQGANLTAWELHRRGIPHTLFADVASALADAARRRRHRHRRRRPRRRQWRRLQQDRHLRKGARRARQRRAVLRRAAVADARLDARFRRRDSDRSARAATRCSPITGRDAYGQTATRRDRARRARTRSTTRST